MKLLAFHIELTASGNVCDTMWQFVLLGVRVCMCVHTGQRISLSVLVRNPDKGPNG